MRGSRHRTASGTGLPLSGEGVSDDARMDSAAPARTAYPDAPNPDLLSRIPLDARVVLDVGCATGALLAAFRPFNPRARLLGIERDPAAAGIAATRLDAVAVADAESAADPFPDEAPPDCLIYGDVLEHLVDPFAVLARHAARMSEDGTILICVPNVEHWSFAARLLGGGWDYEAAGLLDRTHLRWFTRDSFAAALARIGLVACDLHPRVFDGARSAAFVQALAPSLAAMGRDPAEYASRAAPLQYVWRVQKHRRPVLSVASTMLKPVGGVSHVRIVHPLQALATDPAIRTRIGGPASGPPAGEEARIQVLHRPILHGAAGLRALGAILAGGALAVTEFDDHPDYLPGMDGGGDLAFAGVHAVQVSTPALAGILRPRNPETIVFANAIRALPPAVNFAQRDRTTLFFGALNRAGDWAPFMPALNAAAERLGERLQFCVVHDQAFADALRTPHVRFVPTCDYDTYLHLLGDCEIAFMPLADTPFNRAKSDLKFIEAAACRTVALASPTVYAGSIRDERTGLLFASPDALRARLLRLVTLPDYARALADGARAEIAASRMLAYQLPRRRDWYRSLWQRRAALTEALVGRVPALREAAEAGGLLTVTAAP